LIVRSFCKPVFEEEALRKLGASSLLEYSNKYKDDALRTIIFGISVQGVDLNTFVSDLKIIRLTSKTLLFIGNILEWREAFLKNEGEFLDLVFDIIKEDNRIFKLKKENDKWTLR